MIILILSKNKGEFTTEQVMNWLYSINQSNLSIVRINGDDLLNKELFVNVNENKFIFDKLEIEPDMVKVVWFRRTFDEDFFLIEPQLFNDFENNKNLCNHLLSEAGTLYPFFESFLEKSSWINSYSQRINKLKVLNLAKKHGLQIPKTYVVNTASLTNTLCSQENFITKALSDPVAFFENGHRYSMYTKRVRKLPKTANFFFPSKLQVEIRKKFELRIFYINSTFYTMAIFSQNDIKTEVDFRNYNIDKPSRCVPFKLPKNIEKCLMEMINELNLSTCSIDMIVSKDNNFYFLEINPVGQFGMVSKPCNYFLEEKFANYIYSLNEQKK